MALAALTVCAALGMCACSPSDDENVFTGEDANVPAWQANLDAITPEVYANIDDLTLEPGTYISIIGKEENTSYWKQVKKGVEQAAEDINEKLGYSGKDEVRVLFNAPEDGEDIDEQVNILDEEMSRYPDVIAIASIDQNASAVQFDLAIENGIPIIAFDSGNSYQGIQCTCMTDNSAAAALGASKLCAAIGDSGEVALIVADSVSENAKERADAFKKEITDNHPQVSVVETIYADQIDSLKRRAAADQLGVSEEDLNAWTAEAEGEKADGQTDTASGASAEAAVTQMTEEAKIRLEDIESIASNISDEEAVAWLLSKHPNLKGCFGTNDDTVMLGVDALSTMDNGDNITLMGFDAGKQQVEALKDGRIDGLVVQNPFGMGYATVVAAARTVLQIGNEARVDTGYTWVDSENLDSEEIKPMLYN